METYGEKILRTLLYDIALNRQSLQVNPEPRLAPDEVKFEDLERAVRSVQRFLGEAIRTIAAEGRTQRSSPSNLPVELFSCIVKNVLAGLNRHKKSGYYRQLTDLCLVCKEWADTIHGLPELWTQVDLSSSRELLEVILSRSGDFPLDIKCHLEFLPVFVVDITMSGVHRWRSLDIHSDNEYAKESLLKQPAPRLKELTITGPKRWVAPTNIFEGTAPQLEVVVVRGCGLPWTSPILSDLKILTLWKIERHAPHINTLLDILTASPRLSELVIGFTHIQLGSYTPSRRVKVPNLRFLGVEYLYSETMRAVLNSIDVPLFTACAFCTRLEGDEEVAVELADVSKRLVALVGSARNGSSNLTLKMGYEDEDTDGEPENEDRDAALKYETEGGHGPLSITVNAYQGQHFDILNYFAGRIQLCTEAPPPNLRLVGIHRTVPKDENTNILFALHRTFPNVREITLDDLGSKAGMIDALCRLFPQPSSETSPLFPHLTTLAVKRDWHDDWAAWLHGYRRHSGKDGAVSPLPSNLILRLEGGLISAECLRALQQLAPGMMSLDNVRVEKEIRRRPFEVDI